MFSRLLPDAVDATGPLDQADDRPRQVVVDDDGAVLKVLAFAEHIGGHQNPQFFRGCDAILLLVALRD